MAAFVLVPGAWIGGWAWRDVAAKLRAAGHDAYSITLTGLGDRSHLGGPDTNLDTHIQDVLSVLVYEDLENAVLVGHSYAGMVITGVADRAPRRQLSQLVYLDAVVPQEGTSLIGDWPIKDQVEAEVRTKGGGWRWPMPEFEYMGQWVSLAGLTDADKQRFRAKAVGQPIGTLTQPLQLTKPSPAAAIPRSYIFCNALPPAAEVPPYVRHAQNASDWRFGELPTGHWPMFSMPTETAKMLLKLV